MPYTRPTLTAIVTRIEADISARLLNGAPVLRRSFLGVLARVFAGIMHLLYGFLSWIVKQIVPGAETNDSEFLEAHADTFGITRRAAAFSEGNITLTGTNAATIPIGSVLDRADGETYTTTSAGTISSGTATVSVIADTAGINGNAVAGVSLSFQSPITGVDQAAVVATGGLIDGVDAETDAELRTRLQERMMNTPHGGSLLDYEAWALEVSGVLIPFVFPLYDQANDVYPAPGYVGVTCATADGIPDAGVVAALQAKFDEVAPVTAVVKAYAPAELSVDIEIEITPDNATVRAAVVAELESLFLRKGAPNSTIPLSQINEAISIADGETDHVLVSPVADVVTTRNEYPVPAVTFS